MKKSSITEVVDAMKTERAYTDKENMIKRFLITGRKSGVLSNSRNHLTEKTKIGLSVHEYIRGHVTGTLDIIAEVRNELGRYNVGPSLFLLAMMSEIKMTKEQTLRYSDLVLGTTVESHELLKFVSYLSTLGGINSRMKRILTMWYTGKTQVELMLKVAGTRRASGWSHKDVLKLLHIKPLDSTDQATFGFCMGKAVNADAVPNRFVNLDTLRNVPKNELALNNFLAWTFSSEGISKKFIPIHLREEMQTKIALYMNGSHTYDELLEDFNDLVEYKIIRVDDEESETRLRSTIALLNPEIPLRIAYKAIEMSNKGHQDIADVLFDIYEKRVAKKKDSIPGKSLISLSLGKLGELKADEPELKVIEQNSVILHYLNTVCEEAVPLAFTMDFMSISGSVDAGVKSFVKEASSACKKLDCHASTEVPVSIVLNDETNTFDNMIVISATGTHNHRAQADIFDTYRMSRSPDVKLVMIGNISDSASIAHPASFQMMDVLGMSDDLMASVEAFLNL